MNHYQQHIFVCTNERPESKPCCAREGAKELSVYLKAQLKALGLHGKAKIRVTQSGCLGRCDEGPCLVIYPEGIWYRAKTREDVDRIIGTYLIDKNLVKDLTFE